MGTALSVPTATEVCDRCGSRAYVLVMLRGRMLTFCQHHGREHTPALNALAASVMYEPVPVR